MKVEKAKLSNFLNDIIEEHDPWNIEKFHISDSSDCVRAIALRMLGYKGEEWDKKPQIIGSAIHNHVQGLLLRGGFVKREDIEVRVEDLALNLAGSADIIISGHQLKRVVESLPGEESASYLLEIKSKGDNLVASGDSSFEKYTKDPELSHIAQVQGYMEYLEIDWALIIYINKRTGESVGFWVKRDATTGKMIKEKALYIKEFVDRKELPPHPYNIDDEKCIGKQRRDGTRYFICPWQKVCWEEMEYSPLADG